MEQKQFKPAKLQVMKMDDIKTYWNSLTKEEKDYLRMHIDEYEEVRRRAYKA